MSVWTDLERLFPAVREDQMKFEIGSRVIVVGTFYLGREGKVVEYSDRAERGYLVLLDGGTRPALLEERELAHDFAFGDVVISTRDQKVYSVSRTPSLSVIGNISVTLVQGDSYSSVDVRDVRPFPLRVGDRCRVSLEYRIGTHANRPITGVITEIVPHKIHVPGHIFVKRDDKRKSIRLNLDLYYYLEALR